MTPARVGAGLQRDDTRRETTTGLGLTKFVVDNSNSLTVVGAITGGVPGTVIPGTATAGVRTAQGFRTAAGNLGFDAVMLDGTWQHFEQTPSFLPNGTFTASDLGLTGRILDVGSGYDSLGRLRLDVLVGSLNNSKLDQTGTIFTFIQGTQGLTANSILGNNVRWVSTYLTPDGGTGFAFGQLIGGTQGTNTTPGTGRLFVRKADASTRVTTLYDGLDQAGGGITEYSQTVSRTGATTIPGNVLGVPITNTNPAWSSTSPSTPTPRPTP